MIESFSFPEIHRVVTDRLRVLYVDRLHLNNIPEKSAGLYSWHLANHEVHKFALSEYHDVFKPKRFSVSLSSDFRDRYSGSANNDSRLSRVEDDDLGFLKTNKSFHKSSQETMNLLTEIFSPPLYIGRSKNLQDRIRKHFQQFDDKLKSKRTWFDTNDLSRYMEEGFPSEKIDDDLESSYFGERLAYFMLKAANGDTSFDQNNLFVKIVIFKKVNYPEEINDFEYFLNRSYCPIFGRK